MAGEVIEGDPYGSIKEEKRSTSADPREVNSFHSRADTDSAQTAAHHTLGPGRNQASPGDHNHSGSNSKLIGTGLSLTVNITGGAPSDATKINNILAMLHKIIDFTQT